MLHSIFQLHIMYLISFKEECARLVNSSVTALDAHLNCNAPNMCTHKQKVGPDTNWYKNSGIRKERNCLEIVLMPKVPPSNTSSLVVSLTHGRFSNAA